MNDLETELVENTSILNIKYRDKNKKIIIPVLEKISKDYQNILAKKRAEDAVVKILLKGQIDLYKKIVRNRLLNYKSIHSIMI